MQMIDALLAETTPQGVVTAAQGFAGEMGVRALSFARAREEGKPDGWGTGRGTWRERYLGEGLCLSDPGYRRETRPRRPMTIRLDRGYPGLEHDRGIMAFCEVMRQHAGTAAMMVPDTTALGHAEMRAITYQTDIPERHLSKWMAQEEDRLCHLARAMLWRMQDLLPGPDLALTPRERAVLELLADGHQFARIADRLGISEKTVEFHTARLRSKLGARTTHAALARAIRQGLI